ncbi:MAG: hypothetical protein AAF532_03510 [Planctomycetota bacterium]
MAINGIDANIYLRAGGIGDGTSVPVLLDIAGEITQDGGERQTEDIELLGRRHVTTLAGQESTGWSFNMLLERAHPGYQLIKAAYDNQTTIGVAFCDFLIADCSDGDGEEADLRVASFKMNRTVNPAWQRAVKLVLPEATGIVKPRDLVVANWNATT